jgi:hypothetical protein
MGLKSRGFRSRQDRSNEPMATENRRTSGECASRFGGGDDRFCFENLYGLIRAADGKVPLLMVCVKRKPLHLVFYAELEESTSIIAGIRLCRNAGSRMGRGVEGQRSAGRGKGASTLSSFPPADPGSVACHVLRLRGWDEGNKGRRWCKSGGRVWEGWKTRTPGGSPRFPGCHHSIRLPLISIRDRSAPGRQAERDPLRQAAQ